MGLFDGMLGNASKIDASKIQQEFARILAPGERVEHAYQLIRDYFVFTDKRLVLVDKQGLTGAKVEYHSIPYKSITHFSVETAGTFDLEPGDFQARRSLVSSDFLGHTAVHRLNGLTSLRKTLSSQ